MSEETVKNHYKGKERCKISLNDQLEDFYEGCKNNTIRRECAYYRGYHEMPQKVCGGDILHVMAYAFSS